MHDRREFVLSGSMAILGVRTPQIRKELKDAAYEEHQAWVDEVITEMLSIKPGMTRKRLLTVFTTEGGLSTATQRTYVSRACGCFKVNVRFSAVGRAEHAAPERATSIEDEGDLIVSISEPFLQLRVTD